MNWTQITVIPENRCGFVTWPKTYHLPPEWFRQTIHNFDLWIITEGYGKIRTKDDRILELKRGSILYLRPNLIHEAWQEPGRPQISMYWFHHELQRNGRNIPSTALKQTPVSYETTDLGFYETIARKIMMLMSVRLPLDPPGFKQRRFEASTLLLSLIVDFDYHARQAKKSQSPPTPSRYIRIHDLISQIYQRPELFRTPAEVAKKAGYSKDHMTRLFQSILKKTSTEVILEARVQKAESLLATSPLSLSEIADACGYQNVYYFSNQFKSRTGRSPSQFRNSISASGVIAPQKRPKA